jgi:hypothetical protein
VCDGNSERFIGHEVTNFTSDTVALGFGGKEVMVNMNGVRPFFVNTMWEGNVTIQSHFLV